MAGQGLLVKVLITLDPHGILINFCILIHFDSHILSELISGIVVSAFLETISFDNQSIYNLESAFIRNLFSEWLSVHLEISF